MSETMSNPGATEMLQSPEIKEAYQVMFIGRLEQFGLGNPNGIPSSLETQEQLDEHARGLSQSLTENQNSSIVGCIDGRTVIGYADENASYAAVDRSAGGTFSDSVMALTSKSDVLKLVQSQNAQDICDEVESMVGDVVGTEGKCSHDMGCGACNGAVNHLRSMNSAPVKDTAAALMNLGPVAEVLDTEFDAIAADEVGLEAEKLADWFETEAWDGSEYTERAKQSNPQGLEKLNGSPDMPFSGHAEDAIGIVVDKTAVISETLMRENNVSDTFVLTLGRLEKVADTLAGQRGLDGKQQAAISGVMWNLAVANNLCHPNMPIFAIVRSA